MDPSPEIAVFRSGSCPYCGHAEAYTLGDGRKKCKRCKRKSLRTKRKPRLASAILGDIVRSFWQVTPAEKGAKEVGINRKTMQHYYMKIRSDVAINRELALINTLGNKTLDVAPFEKSLGDGIYPVMGLLVRENEICVLFPQTEQRQPGNIAANCLIYSPDHRTYEGINLDRFLFYSLKGICHEKTRGEWFWNYTKKGLKKYRGGFRKNFHLFVREMEFRFNATGSESYLQLLSTLEWQQ